MWGSQVLLGSQGSMQGSQVSVWGSQGSTWGSWIFWGSRVPVWGSQAFRGVSAGNTVLVLCSPEVAPPLLYLAELSGEGGALPPGVLNVVTGPLPELCRALRARPDVAAVAFLGAPQEQVQGLVWGSPCRGPRVGGARGGRVVVVVLDSADLDGAAAAIVGAAGTPPALFPWGGCVVLAQEGVLAPLERRLRARLGGLRVGDPLDLGTDVGPLPPMAPHPRELVEAAREEGAETG
ncbi:PREDICTED: aldehyde dehydrogenase family 16 member A1-like [Lepidothrix coronata]|uniref:Aldehyde dehydrogenase family 16 member A1-like n=1 Tax=Lepidothrix coronata TaxID=321398 RepID=A0A6J0JBC4_9PASS|nr:PREDICTED: aldehyde dehydrogenase family 16 member A1-like [Lepidothrix coronata]